MTPGRRPAPGVFFVGASRAARGFIRDAKGAQKPVVGGEIVRIALLILFGTAGTLARYGLQGLVQQRTGSSFPSGTLAVNLAGCFLLGGIAEYALTHLTIPPEWRIGITVGFFGAFTTFSSFSWETARMLQDGEWRRAAIYLLTSVIGGLVAVFAGMRIAERI
jgi:CrcB protein